MHWLRALVVALSLASFQAEPGGDDSAWITGKVLHADGTPWSTAAVVLLSHRASFPNDPFFAERVEVASGQDGSFRAQLRPGRSYTAWSASAVTEGKYRVSEALGGVCAGQSITLREREQVQCVVQVKVHGLEAWKACAPFSYSVACSIEDRLVVPCAVDAAGLATIGPVPGNSVWFFVERAGGAVIGIERIALGEKERVGASVASGAGGGSTATTPAAGRPVTLTPARTDIGVPPPAELRVKLTGPKGPVQGARFYSEPGASPLIGESDRNGLAVLREPALWGGQGAPFLAHVSYFVTGPNCAVVNWYGDEIACTSDKGRQTVNELRLPKGNSIQGRLFWAPGRPAAEVPILLHTGVPGGQRFDENQATYNGGPQLARSDKKGNFTIGGVAPQMGWQLSLLIPPEAAKDLPSSPEFPLSPYVVLASGEDASASVRDLGSIVLSTRRPLDLTIRRKDGQPLAWTPLFFREELSAMFQEERVESVCTDARGRVRLLARPGTSVLLSLPDKEGKQGAAVERVKVEEGKQPMQYVMTAQDR